MSGRAGADTARIDHDSVRHHRAAYCIVKIIKGATLADVGPKIWRQISPTTDATR